MQNHMRCWLGVGLLSLLSTGCLSKQTSLQAPTQRSTINSPQLPHQRSLSNPSYSVSPSPKVCRHLPKRYGYQKTSPIEPGRYGKRMGRSILWRCPSGVIARMRRLGTAGKARYKSKSPLVGKGPEVVEQWLVKCPQTSPKRVYVNAQRQGNGCAPKPFSNIPRLALHLRVIALQQAKQRRYNEALRTIDKALKITGELALFYQSKAIILMYSKRFSQAIRVLGKVLAMRTQIQPSNRLLLGIAHLKMGRYKKYGSILNFLLVRLSYQDRIYPHLLCRKAIFLRQTGHLGPSTRMAKKSCQMGEKRCCRVGS